MDMAKYERVLTPGTARTCECSPWRQNKFIFHHIHSMTILLYTFLTNVYTTRRCLYNYHSDKPLFFFIHHGIYINIATCFTGHCGGGETDMIQHKCKIQASSGQSCNTWIYCIFFLNVNQMGYAHRYIIIIYIESILSNHGWIYKCKLNITR